LSAAAVSLLLFVSISGAYAYFQHEYGKIDVVNVFGSHHKASTAAINFLLVGSDSSEGLTKAQVHEFHLGAHDRSGRRSDTMILLHLNKSHDKAILISFPRDSWVTIPAFHGTAAHTAKINSAFSEGGAKLAIKTIVANTGVPIDHYVQVNVLGLANIVDALGGVRVCLAHPINDAVGGDHGFGGSGLVAPAGWNRFNGVQAVKFARTRHDLADQDLGRIKRQQALLGALFHEAVKAGTLLNPLKLNRFINAAVKSVKVDNDFTPHDMFTLAGTLQHLGPKHVTFLTVPIANSNYRTADGQSAVLWDETAAKRLFHRIKADTPINGKKRGHGNLTVPPSAIYPQVQNGTTTNGLAHKAADDLVAAGFHVSGTPGDAAHKGLQATEIHYGSDRADSARTLAAAIPGSRLVSDG